MKIGNRRRGIYSEEKRAQQRPSERGSEGGNWRGRRKGARESERESVGKEGGFFLFLFFFCVGLVGAIEKPLASWPLA